MLFHRPTLRSGNDRMVLDWRILRILAIAEEIEPGLYDVLHRPRPS